MLKRVKRGKFQIDPLPKAASVFRDLGCRVVNCSKASKPMTITEPRCLAQNNSLILREVFHARFNSAIGSGAGRSSRRGRRTGGLPANSGWTISDEPARRTTLARIGGRKLMAHSSTRNATRSRNDMCCLKHATDLG